MTDETNVRPSRRGRFFIYGGVFFPSDAAPSLHAGVARIREHHGFGPGDEFKFDSRSRPSHVSPQRFAQAKREALGLCAENEVKFIAYAVLHAIARERDISELVSWGADHVVGKFNHFLSLEDAKGICVVDRLPFQKGFDYLREQFQSGLTFCEDGEEEITVPLSNVMLFSTTCIGASHLSSIIDIVLGCFRYCVNERQKTQILKEIYPQVAKLMWHRQVGSTIYFREYGLVLRPKEVKVLEYKDQYDDLVEHLQSLLE